MQIVEFNPKDKAKAKKFFKLRGSIKACAETIDHDRTTISRIVKVGTGEKEIITKIIDYVNDNSDTAA